MKTCPCHSKKPYNQCCRPYHDDNSIAPTAEALMRSRFSAYSLIKIDYIEKTMTKAADPDFDFKQGQWFATSVTWLNLEIKELVAGQSDDDYGEVLFTAQYKHQGQIKTIQEHSLFTKIKDQWFYSGSKELPTETH